MSTTSSSTASLSSLSSNSGHSQIHGDSKESGTRTTAAGTASPREATLKCCSCLASQPVSLFPPAQLKKGFRRRCSPCIKMSQLTSSAVRSHRLSPNIPGTKHAKRYRRRFRSAPTKFSTEEEFSDDETQSSSVVSSPKMLREKKLPLVMEKRETSQNSVGEQVGEKKSRRKTTPKTQRKHRRKKRPVSKSDSQEVTRFDAIHHGVASNVSASSPIRVHVVNIILSHCDTTLCGIYRFGHFSEVDWQRRHRQKHVRGNYDMMKLEMNDDRTFLWYYDYYDYYTKTSTQESDCAHWNWTGFYDIRDDRLTVFIDNFNGISLSGAIGHETLHFSENEFKRLKMKAERRGETLDFVPKRIDFAKSVRNLSSNVSEM